MEEMNMKKKTVTKLLTMCMVASLSVGTPVITWASDTGTTNQKSAESDSIEVSVKSPTPVIWDEEDVIVKVQDTHYDDNSGNPFYQIEFMVENNSSVDVRIGGGNACEKWELTLTLYKDDTEVSSKTLNIAKEVFENEENTSDIDNIEEKSDTEESEKSETVDANVEELQTENAELKEKNSEIETTGEKIKRISE